MTRLEILKSYGPAITGIGVVLGLLAAIFLYVDARSPPAGRARAHVSYNEIWKALLHSPWNKVAIRLTGLLKQMREDIEREFRTARYGQIITRLDRIGLYSGSVATPYFLNAAFGHVAMVSGAVLTIPYALGVLINHVTYGCLDRFLRSESGTVLVQANLIGLSCGVVALLMWMQPFSLPQAFSVACVSLPAVWSLLARWFDAFAPQHRLYTGSRLEVSKLNGGSLERRGSFQGITELRCPGRVVEIFDGVEVFLGTNERPNALFHQNFAAFTLAVSLVVTVGAAYIGQIVKPGSPYVLSPQLFAASAICDFSTIVATIMLLEATTVGRVGIWKALVVDIVVVAALAMLSLWAGTAWSQASNSWHDVWMIMLGLDASGRQWEFGSNFWILHTAFFPPLAFLVLLAALLFQRSLLNAVAWALGRDPWSRPHLVTAVALGLISAIAITLHFVLDQT